MKEIYPIREFVKHPIAGLLIGSALFLMLMTGIAFADEPKPIPDCILVNQDGGNFNLHSLKGTYVLVTFVYTRCPMPDMCPLTMKLSRDLIAKWKEQPALIQKGFPLKILAVTLDPDYDTPEVLKKYAETQGMDPDHFIFATGDPKTLSDLASQFNVLGIPSDGTISHNVKAALLSPLAIPLAEYKDNQWKPDEVLTTIRKSVSWWRWFYVASALLAIPGVLLLIRLRRYNLDANTIGEKDA